MPADLLAPEREEEYDAALGLLAARPLVVLTGAGVSTDSGIPDYRGPGRPVRSPMTYQEFCSGPEAQQRYWARAFVGWATMGGAEPNAGHHALARVAPGLLITQNVDGLHERAGTPRTVALHGRIAEVVCLSCRRTTAREGLQARLAELNPGFLEAAAGAVARPDGDVELSGTDGFVVAACDDCGGVLKPHVVFFGENVPADRVARCYDAVDALRETDGALLVVGLVARRHERPALRAPRRERRNPGRHRQPRRHPRRPARHPPPRSRDAASSSPTWPTVAPPSRAEAATGVDSARGDG